MRSSSSTRQSSLGEEDEVVAIRQILREQARRGCAFVLITGASGSGKSSLARAGVLPAIVAHEIDGDVTGWCTAVLTPAEGEGDLLLTLARALAAERSLPALRCEPDSIVKLASDLGRDPEMACRRVLLPDLMPVRATVFSFSYDQIEELFSDQRFNIETRDVFFRALEALARCGRAWGTRHGPQRLLRPVPVARGARANEGRRRPI